MLRLFLICLFVLAGLAHAGEPAVVLQTWHDAARQRDIPVKLRVPDGAGPFPVIVYSHGLGGSREGGSAWGEHWARQGLLVIHLQHPGSDELVWRQAEGNRFRALKSAASAAQLKARVEDVHFALDELARRKATGALAKASLDQIGMAGHSFGAVTTQAVAGQHYPLIGTRWREPRIKAFLAFSPSARREGGAFDQFDRPFFSMTGTEDGDPLGSGMSAADREKPYAAMPAGGKYLLVLAGRTHDFFGGDRLLVGDSIESRQQALLREASAQFWRAHLRYDPNAAEWLRGNLPAQAKAADARYASK
ncbi:hypothetical protein [Chitinimonas sp. BJYL2]|uniref:alpha/beta hydrolase family protein n=1 Tax=Chitinimonas sp. BJYL2 TaxID=2976696 RepID=UPI0022B39D91|nr:hypothetical protein [Chitinimonas sp. BJYL2]